MSPAALFRYASAALLTVPFILLGSHRVSSWLIERAGARRVFTMILPALALPALAALSRGAPGSLAEDLPPLLAHSLIVFGLAGWAAWSGPGPRAGDWLAIAAAWIPVRLDWLPPVWPAGDPGVPGGEIWYPALLLLIPFKGFRRLDGIGFRWRIRLEDAGAALVASAAIIVVAFPLTAGLGASLLPAGDSTLAGTLLGVAGLAFFVALPSELLFRGLLFNMLQRSGVSRRGPWPALLLSALLFGLSAWQAPGAPGAGMFAFAAFAGGLYGWCFLKTGNLTAGGLAHTLVLVISGMALVPVTAGP